ncbi:MAG: YihA family ribosome biogenesis GTP-binding protein [Cytophagales bacterium]|nr:MAG: YihA family ribosome biogenesis GTP-binding protein [Cytophagales bacterium]
MKITKAIYLQGNVDYKKCPPTNKPEFAFIGRSNVGKSSIINMLTDNRKLAQVSASPGKTKLINHFLINDNWYLVDLPGYGWARTSKSSKQEWDLMTKDYLTKRENMICAFVLIDSCIEAQQIDLDYMEGLATHGIPFVILFTKADRTNKTKINGVIEQYKNKMKETWEELPQMFITSSKNKLGKEEILEFIDDLVKDFFSK